MPEHKWKVKTGKPDGFLEFGHKTRVYYQDRQVGEALGRTRKESRDRAIDRAIEKVAREQQQKK